MSKSMERLLCETRHVFHADEEARDGTLASAGVTAIERHMIEALAHEDLPVTVAALARRALSPVATIIRGLDTLDGRGWLERRGDCRTCASDGVRLNEAGRAAWRRLQANEQSRLMQIEAALDEQSVRATLATLRVLRRALQRATDYTTSRPRERP